MELSFVERLVVVDIVRLKKSASESRGRGSRGGWIEGRGQMEGGRDKVRRNRKEQLNGAVISAHKPWRSFPSDLVSPATPLRPHSIFTAYPFISI